MRSKITILFMIINLFVYSQNPQGDYATNKYSIIPPAPEVASLMRYIDIPVSHFNYMSYGVFEYRNLFCDVH